MNHTVLAEVYWVDGHSADSPENYCNDGPDSCHYI